MIGLFAKSSLFIGLFQQKLNQCQDAFYWFCLWWWASSKSQLFHSLNYLRTRKSWTYFSLSWKFRWLLWDGEKSEWAKEKLPLYTLYSNLITMYEVLHSNFRGVQYCSRRERFTEHTLSWTGYNQFQLYGWGNLNNRDELDLLSSFLVINKLSTIQSQLNNS